MTFATVDWRRRSPLRRASRLRLPKICICDTFLGPVPHLGSRVAGGVRGPEPLRLTAYTDFSLRVLMYLGLNPDHAATVKEIAENFGVSRNHLMKVVHRLSIFGYVETLRGRGGGLHLARQPEDIRVGAVVRDTEDDLAAVPCLRPGPSECCIRPACVLRDAMQAATGAFLDVLDHYTLADLLKPAERLGSLLADHAQASQKSTA